ncbi:Octanoyltransferase [Poriferisphaera corsica]|uniref:Octanoyltransferase n=1 Tax=Poriferisphaera corsica TaxID=2528020 RepID=A0A517YWW7_9BACT|nr:lipoyl(octanoyl) transferase LipB [Poriferisphaera corsica]QDU34706.1 Octanoyltransferase [Poriferisphaera corsica]
MDHQRNSSSEYHVGSLPITVTDLNRLSYAPAFDLQRQTNLAVSQNTAPNTIFLVEHNPVITITPKQSAQANLVASPDHLASLGIETAETDRGGDITYHGPGQLVVYPIIRLSEFNLNLSKYMRLLEQTVIDTLAHYHLTAQREPGNTGVWIPPQPSSPPCTSNSSSSSTLDPTRNQSNNAINTLDPTSGASGISGGGGGSEKVCAMGVRIRKNTTMHGLALNVTTDLSHFQTIIPCGLTDRGVTSLAKLLPNNTPTMPEVKQILTHNLITLLQKSHDNQFEF